MSANNQAMLPSIANQLPEGLRQAINDYFKQVGDAHEVEEALFECAEAAVTNDDMSGNTLNNSRFLFVYRRTKELVEELWKYKD